MSNNMIRNYNLHKVWDEDLFDIVRKEFMKKVGDTTGKRWFGYREIVDIVLEEYDNKKHIPDNLGTPNDWYNEARALHPIAYPDGNKVAPAKRVYCKTVDPKTGSVIEGSYDPKKIPVLSDEFIEQAIPVIKKQIFLAGLRLADAINKMAEKVDLERLPSDKDILDELKLENTEKREKTKHAFTCDVC